MSFRIFEDRPSQYDNWNLDASYREKKMWGCQAADRAGSGGVRTCADHQTVRHFLDSKDTTGHDRVSEITGG